MAQINLLPWREEFRQEKKKEFYTQLIGVCIIAVLIAFMWVGSVNGSISNQNERNKILQDEINLLSKQVKEIEKLKQERRELIDRMQVIQDLEGKRSIIVHYFDAFARSVPDGIYLRSVERKGDVVIVSGVSDSNNRISSFMRQLDESEWYAEPNLNKVVAAPQLGEQSATFTMDVKLVIPSTEEDDNG